MRNELEQIELIERYLLEQLSAEEKTKFEAELKTNPKLQEKVTEQRQLIEGSKRLALEQKVKQAGRNYFFRKNALKWGTTVIAIGVVALGIYLLAGNKSETTQNKAVDPFELPALNENGDSLWADADKYLPYQYFELNADQDTVIETENGIVFAIPAGVFLDENGNAVTGKIKFEVKEALNTADILSAGLSTMSEGRELETAGMFYLNARQNEKSLKINPEKGIHTEVPANEIKNGMQLFEGKRMPDGQIDWVNPKPLEKELVCVDILDLNFYPPHYEDTLASLGKDYQNKKYTDSLYYSYAFNSNLPIIEPVAEIEKHTTNNNKNVKQPYKGDTTAINIQTGTTSYSSTYFATDSIRQEAAVSGLDPAKVKAIWNENYNNTLLATREFEERMSYIHNNCNNAVLDTYVNNLDKNLCTVDSMAAKLVGGKFYEFAARGDGKVKADAPHLVKLKEYYEEKQELVRQATEQTRNEYYKKHRKLDEVAGQKRNEQRNTELKQAASNFKEEYKLNLCNAYGQIGKPCPQPPPPATYSINVTSTGWKNLDVYVFESTLSRSTLDYTDPETGKKAVIRYEEASVTVKNREEYEAVFVYIIPDQLNSFQRMNEMKGVFSEKLNELINYQLVVLAYKNREPFFLHIDSIQPGRLENLNPVQTEKTKLDEKLAVIKNFGQSTDLVNEFAFRYFEGEERKRQKDFLDLATFRERMRGTVFPCACVVDTTWIWNSESDKWKSIGGY